MLLPTPTRSYHHRILCDLFFSFSLSVCHLISSYTTFYLLLPVFVLSGNRIAQYVFCRLNLCSALLLRFIYVETYSGVYFHCCIVFRFMNKPQFVLYCWARRLFPAFAYRTDWLLWTFLVPVQCGAALERSRVGLMGDASPCACSACVAVGIHRHLGVVRGLFPPTRWV